MSDLRSAVEALRRAVVMDWGPTVESAVAIIDAHQCLPPRGRIRIRTPDDKPGHWTAHGDLVPGVPYTYWSGDVAVVVDWEGAVPTDVVDISSQCLPSEEELAAALYEVDGFGFLPECRETAAAILATLRERRVSSESEEPRQPPAGGGVDKLPPDGRMPTVTAPAKAESAVPRTSRPPIAAATLRERRG